MILTEYRWPIRGDLRPMSHQITTTGFVLKNKRCFVLNEMGTGKTLSILWALDILFTHKKIRRALVVSPLSTIRLVWANEIFFNMPHRKYAVCHGTRNQRIQALRSPAEIVIINHDGIKTVFDELEAECFDVIVIDELTAFKAHGTERTKTMTKLAKKAKAVWGLTGEPTPNSPIEAFSQARIVNPANPALPRYFTAFREMTMVKINEFVWHPKPEAPKIVSRVLAPAIRFRRDECIDLPPTTYQTLEVPLSDEQQAAYARMKKDMILEYQSGKITAVNAAVALNKLLQISAGSVRMDDGTTMQINCKPRLDALMDIFEQTPQRKLIIFATYTASIRMLVEFAMKHGISAQPFYGDVNPAHRLAYINDFQNGSLNWLVMQPQSSAHGLTLVASSTITWFSLIASNEYYNQANARIVRPGQLLKTLITRFASTGAEKHMVNILDRKGKLSDSVLQLFTNGQL